MSKGRLKPVLFYFLLVLLLTPLPVIIRGILYEPFRIPSESMMPTLLIGDHIWVKKFAYGLLNPFTGNYFSEGAVPQRGDVVVFSFPDEPGIVYVKRIVGIPGDTLEFRDGELYLNRVSLKTETVAVQGESGDDACTVLTAKSEIPESMRPYPYFRRYREYEHLVEDLLGVKHIIIRSKHRDTNEMSITVPKGNYFMMGDNRDKSRDSRYMGVVPQENILGKAVSVWISVNHDKAECEGPLGKTKSVRWYRWGREIE